MLISPAYAQGVGGGLGGIGAFAPLILIFVVFYMLLIRPQQKKARTHRDMVGNVRRGDSVVTGGGIIGKVTKVIDNDRLQVEIADGVRVMIAKGTVADVMSRGQPVREPPTRRAGKKKVAARQEEPEEETYEESEEETYEEPEDDEDDVRFEDVTEEETEEEPEEEPEEKPRPKKRGRK